MQMNVAAAARAIAAAANWSVPQPGPDGACAFRLNRGAGCDLDFRLFSPDGRTLVFLADLCSAGTAGDADSDDKVRRIASLAAARLASFSSTLFLSNGRFQLHLSLPLHELGEQDAASQARRFLNELSWWRSRLDNGNAVIFAQGTASPFTFGPDFSLPF